MVEPHPLFDAPDAERRFLAEAPAIPRSDASWYIRALNGDSDGTVSWVPSRQEQTVWFAQLRFAEHRASTEPGRPRWAELAVRLREDIANANLPLVLAVAKRWGHGDDFDERVAQGNLAMARAIDGFDPFRGIAFSTYATRAILNAFSRERQRVARRAARKWSVVKVDEDGFGRACAVRGIAAERDGRAAELRDEQAASLHAAIERACLTDDEHYTLVRRFLTTAEPVLFQSIAHERGVTKERARQWCESAMMKLREQLSQNTAP